MTASNSPQTNKDPLHGLTLKAILTEMVEQYGFDGLAQRIKVRCFSHDPSIKSSLTFLRKTQWAREKLERLYLTSKGLPIPPHLLDSSTPATREKPAKQICADKPQTNAHIWGKKTD
ncbi:VF530 family protein [Shewanella indica]|uniref:VF530 family protein n=1 Tax=Shewanella indica TaxID=768528 RepID=UPI0030046AB4